MNVDRLRTSAERVLRVAWSDLPLSRTDVLADAAARLWWRHHDDSAEADFYRTSLAYACHQLDRATGDQSAYDALADVLHGRRVETVLDFGCGIGQVGYHLIDRGFIVDFADLDTPAFRICADYGAASHSNFVTLPEGLSQCPRYDAILLLDVLEHTPDPLDLWQHLAASHLSSQGVIAAIPTFGSSTEQGVRMRPEHLASNDRYWGSWTEQLRSAAGWTPVAEAAGATVYGRLDQ